MQQRIVAFSKKKIEWGKSNNLCGVLQLVMAGRGSTCALIKRLAGEVVRITPSVLRCKKDVYLFYRTRWCYLYAMDIKILFLLIMTSFFSVFV